MTAVFAGPLSTVALKAVMCPRGLGLVLEAPRGQRAVALALIPKSLALITKSLALALVLSPWPWSWP